MLPSGVAMVIVVSVLPGVPDDSACIVDFSADATRCRREGGGLSDFLRLRQVAQLGWPRDVVEQLLFDHAEHEAFHKDYGAIDLRQVVWCLQAIPVDVLMEVPTGWSERDAIECFAEDWEHWVSVRKYGEHVGVGQMWDVHGTWKRWPLLLDQSLLGQGRRGLQLIEGRTRVGVLRGRRRQGAFVAERHLAWVGSRV